WVRTVDADDLARPALQGPLRQQPGACGAGGAYQDAPAGDGPPFEHKQRGQGIDIASGRETCRYRLGNGYRPGRIAIDMLLPSARPAQGQYPGAYEAGILRKRDDSDAFVACHQRW